MTRPWVYDLMYRTWAPWDSVGVRSELRALLERGEITPRTHPRALDLGCGTGSNVVHLASLGHDATGVDFSPVALAKARARATAAGVACSFIEADLTADALDIGEPFDLVMDFGTLDDLNGAGRRRMAGHIAALTRAGGTVLFWCFYGPRSSQTRNPFRSPNRWVPMVEPDEVDELFAAAFEIEPFMPKRWSRGTACFVGTRRAG